MKEILDKEKVLADLKYWQVPGMAVSYVKVSPDKDGRYAADSFAGGYGVRETGGEPVDENTRFCIASCSKAMTSAVIAMLVTEGKLSYDVPVKEYLPGFAMMDAEADEKMTLRDMLCHRTGLAPHDGTDSEGYALSQNGACASRRNVGGSCHIRGVHEEVQIPCAMRAVSGKSHIQQLYLRACRTRSGGGDGADP